MDLKRTTIWAAVVAVVFASPALAANCCDDVGCCDMSCCCAKTCNIEVGGWIEAGIYANQYGAKDNGPLTMRNYADGATLDQMWIYAEKAADNGGHGLAFGGRVDFVWGADGPDTQCFGDGTGAGWDYGWFTSSDQNYGSALPQLYGEIAYNDLSVKIGHFYTIIGYEVVPAPDNFFYSHSDTLAIEPYTHTGALAEYALTDNITILGGWTNGWDNGWLNPRNASTFLGGVSLDLSDDMSLIYATSFGDLQEQTGHTWTTYMHSLVFDWNINSRLEYVFQSDFRTDSDEINGTIQKYYGINQYFFYKLSNRWSAGTRFEWLRTEIDNTSYNAAEVTLGLNYRPSERIVVRPEIRWDSYGGNPAASALMFDNNTRSSQFAGGCDVIVKY